jgi:hypothetical protein
LRYYVLAEGSNITFRIAIFAADPPRARVTRRYQHRQKPD